MSAYQNICVYYVMTKLGVCRIFRKEYRFEDRCKMEKFDHLYFYKNNGELFGDGNLHIQTDVDEYERQGYVEKFVIRARMVKDLGTPFTENGLY